MEDPITDALDTSTSAKPLLEIVLGIACVIALLVLMSITVVDVIGRTSAGLSVSGAYELSELTIGILVAIGLPLVAMRSGHLAIDMLQARFTGKFLTFQSASVSIITCMTEVFLAWCMYEQALRASEVSRMTSMLQIPVAPVLYVIAACLLFSGVITLVMLLRPKPFQHKEN